MYSVNRQLIKQTDIDEHTLTKTKVILQLKICFSVHETKTSPHKPFPGISPSFVQDFQIWPFWISQVGLNLVDTHSPVWAYRSPTWEFGRLLCTLASFLCTNTTLHAQTHSETVCYPSFSLWFYLGHGSPESSSIIKLKIRNSTGLLILGKALLLSSLTCTHSAGHSDTFFVSNTW